MKYILAVILIILLCIAQNVLSQNTDTLFNRYQYWDSIVQQAADNHPEQAIIAARKQLDIAKALQNDSLYYLASINKAKALNELSMFDQTTAILYELLSKYEKKGNDARTSKVCYYLGASYFQMEDYEKANIFFKKSKSAALAYKLYEDTIGINSELGLTLVALGQNELGFGLLINSVSDAKKQKNEESICIALDNLSNAYFENEDFQNALKYQEEILRYRTFVESSLQTQAAIYQHLGTINIQLKRWSEAQKYTDLSIKYASQLGSNYWLFDCYKDQADIYEATGKYKEALVYHQKYVTLKDSVYKSDYDIKMSSMANLYELESKEHQISQWEGSHALASAKIQRLYLFLGALVLLCALMLTFYLYKKSRADKELQQKIAFQLLQAQEDERQRISKELHDSVGQNILFIKNQIAKPAADLDKITKSADAAMEELRNISKNLYPNQLEKYGLVAAVDALAKETNNQVGIFVSYDMEGIDEVLNKNVKINFYRIIQEFVNNTIKHAEASAIRITTNHTNDSIELVVQDNGKGFDKSEIEKKYTRSFGLLNMEERIKMLKGKCSIESAPGKGTKSVFTIPI